jgi:hypothetical protein
MIKLGTDSELSGEVNSLFMYAINTRRQTAESMLRSSFLNSIRHVDDDHHHVREVDEISCDCDDGCEEDLKQICHSHDFVCDNSPFRFISEYLCLTKAHDYVALAEDAYGRMGNRFFSFSDIGDAEVTDADIENVANLVKAELQRIIDSTGITIDELGTVIDPSALIQMVADRESTIRSNYAKMKEVLYNRIESQAEAVLDDTNFLTEYMNIVRDTTIYPIGVLWTDLESVSNESFVKNGKIVNRKVEKIKVERVPPYDVWFTPDYRRDRPGRAVFRVKRLSKDTLEKMRDDTSTHSKIRDEITQFLIDYPDGGFPAHILLFQNYMPFVDWQYDVLCVRGKFRSENVRSYVSEKIQSDYVECEIWYSGSAIIKVSILKLTDKYRGVYTTSFRYRDNDSMWGIGLWDFALPFAKTYESVWKEMNESVGRSLGAIVQIDRALVENLEDLQEKDPTTGKMVLNLTNKIVEIDTSKTVFNPNSKGVGVIVDVLPSNLEKLGPLLSMALDALEQVTKVPRMLTDGGDISSALRTTSNFNAAFAASNKVIQSLLRTGEKQVIEPFLKLMFQAMLLKMPDLSKELGDNVPEIILSDTMARTQGDNQLAAQALQFFSAVRDRIPEDNFNALINAAANRTYGIKENLVPTSAVITQQPQPMAEGV